MDWIIYWFMFPVCVLIASIAMFSGISGAAMLFPVIVIGFPLFGVPPLTTVEAVGVSLFLETSGFGTGVYGYVRKGLVDLVTVRSWWRPRFRLLCWELWWLDRRRSSCCGFAMGSGCSR